MLNTAKLFFNDEFNRNVLTLVTGTGLAQLIPLAVTPILSRIYSPDHFGVLALFAATVSSLSVLSTGRYELAIMLPRKDGDAVNIVALSLAICLVISIFLLVVVRIFYKPLSETLNNGAMSTWMYLVPFALLLNGIYSNLSYWSNRKKFYRLMAGRRVLQSGGTSAAQLGLGLLRADPAGLVIGTLCGQALATGTMLHMIGRRGEHLWQAINRKKIWILARRHKSCPQFLVPAHTLAAISVQLPVIFMSATFGLGTSGSFMLAERVAGVPLSLVSASIGDVFRQKMSERYLAGEHCRREFLSTLRKLVAIATIPFLMLFFFSPSLFAVVFGERWRVAGEYARLMCPMFYLHFISNPLSLVTIVAQKNRFEFLWQVSLFVSLVLGAMSYYVIRLDAKDYVVMFVVVYVMFDILHLFASYKFASAGDLPKSGKL